MDIECSNLAVMYEAYVRKKTENGHTVTKHTKEQLQAMVDAVKGLNSDHKTTD
jgi:hypothetical protein